MWLQPSTKCITTVDEPKFRRQTVPHSRSRDGKSTTAKLRPRPDCNSRSGRGWTEPAPGGVRLGESNKVAKVCRTTIVKDIVHKSSDFKQYSIMSKFRLKIDIGYVLYRLFWVEVVRCNVIAVCSCVWLIDRARCYQRLWSMCALWGQCCCWRFVLMKNAALMMFCH